MNGKAREPKGDEQSRDINPGRENSLNLSLHTSFSHRFHFCKSSIRNSSNSHDKFFDDNDCNSNPSGQYFTNVSTSFCITIEYRERNRNQNMREKRAVEQKRIKILGIVAQWIIQMETKTFSNRLHTISHINTSFAHLLGHFCRRLAGCTFDSSIGHLGY